MLISYTHKFIFIHTYKVAGSSIAKALSKYAYNPSGKILLDRISAKLGAKPPGSYSKSGDFPVHVKASVLKEKLPPDIYNSFFKFAFVRNPWDWQVSLYHYMTQDKTHFQHELIKQQGSFKGYIRWLSSQGMQQQKPVMTNKQGEVIVDFIGRYENLQEDFQHICKTLNVEAFLPHIRKSNHHDYRLYYDDETRRLVAEGSKEDIEFFNYTFSS